ncbi:hypothetical protein BDQ17DRAFT_1373257 [Cyathus striatus]|nr:hypothetical protein BDQ17DRAFT_1373257 [Cyathus striatus]
MRNLNKVCFLFLRVSSSLFAPAPLHLCLCHIHVSFVTLRCSSFPFASGTRIPLMHSIVKSHRRTKRESQARGEAQSYAVAENGG